MKQFLVKAAKHPGNDPFGMSEATEFIYFHCAGLTDLRNTIRCITPQGFRVRRKEWFSKYLKYGPTLALQNPFFNTLMYEVKQISFFPVIAVKKEFTNQSGFTHILKRVDADQWDILIKP